MINSPEAGQEVYRDVIGRGYVLPAGSDANHAVRDVASFMAGLQIYGPARAPAAGTLRLAHPEVESTPGGIRLTEKQARSTVIGGLTGFVNFQRELLNMGVCGDPYATDQASVDELRETITRAQAAIFQLEHPTPYVDPRYQNPN